MRFVRTIKETIGLVEPPTRNTFECQDCGHTFESSQEEASYWTSCETCESRDVEKIGG